MKANRTTSFECLQLGNSKYKNKIHVTGMPVIYALQFGMVRELQRECMKLESICMA